MKTESKNIICSTSAGYSSVMMAIKMKDWYPDHNIINVMANVSREHKKSLEFMNKCDKYFGLNLVWIEPSISQKKNVGTGFEIRTFNELKTEGQLFEDGIKKYGIPSVVNKWCTRELKLVPIKKYADKKFGANNYSIAVGLRMDEMDRVSKNYFQNNVFYPLLDNGINTRVRNKFWFQKPIQIGIPAFKGNCRKCFEKSDRKNFTDIKHDIRDNINDFWIQEMERKYSHIKIEGKENYNSFIEKFGGHFMFRKNRSIEDMIEQALTLKYYEATDEYAYESDLFDFEDNCGSGCTVFE